jgi:hypothetical protein
MPGGNQNISNTTTGIVLLPPKSVTAMHGLPALADPCAAIRCSKDITNVNPLGETAEAPG